MRYKLNPSDELDRSEMRAKAAAIVRKARPCDVRDLQWVADGCGREINNIELHEALMEEIGNYETAITPA